MPEVKYQYAYDENGKIVSACDLTKETSKQHSYTCIGCGARMFPRSIESSSRKPHFYHKDEVICSSETYLHKLGKRIIKERFDGNEQFPIAYEATVSCKENECPFRYSKCSSIESKKFDLKKYYDTCEEEVSIEGFIADLLLTHSEHPDREPVLIEICVTHPCDEKKINSGLRIIELCIHNEKDIESLSRWLLKETEKDSINKYPAIRFYNFKRDFPEKKIVNIGRFIYRPQYDINGTSRNIKCCDAGNKLFNDSLVELNFIHEVSLGLSEPMETPLFWMYKNKNFRRCVMCRYYQIPDYWYSNSICRLNNKFGIPNTPDVCFAEKCSKFSLAERYYPNSNVHSYVEVVTK